MSYLHMVMINMKKSSLQSNEVLEQSTEKQ